LRGVSKDRRALSSAADPSRLAALRRAPQDDGNPLCCLLKKFFRIPYPRVQNLAYHARVLSNKGSLSRSDPLSGQSESWPDRGVPERSTAWWLVERWEALRLALGAHGALPCEVGTLIPPLGVPIGALAPPTAPSPRAGSARDWQTSDALRRENVEVWLFEIVDQKIEARRLSNLAPLFAGRGRRASSDARRVRGQALRSQIKKLSGRKVSTQQARPERPSIVFSAVPRPSPEAFAALRLRPLPARAGRGLARRLNPAR
jgi:hypothetical protein